MTEPQPPHFKLFLFKFQLCWEQTGGSWGPYLLFHVEDQVATWLIFSPTRGKKMNIHIYCLCNINCTFVIITYLFPPSVIVARLEEVQIMVDIDTIVNKFTYVWNCNTNTCWFGWELAKTHVKFCLYKKVRSRLNWKIARNLPINQLKLIKWVKK